MQCNGGVTEIHISDIKLTPLWLQGLAYDVGHFA